MLMGNSHTKNRGFTLVELMVVVCIIGVLASIAGSRFMDFIRKSRTSEAILVLGRLRQDMQGHKDGFGFYTASLDRLWGESAPSTNSRFVYGFKGGVTNDNLCTDPADTVECYSTFGETEQRNLDGVGNNDIDAIACLRNDADKCTYLKPDYNPRFHAGIKPFASHWTNGEAVGFMAIAAGNVDSDDSLEKWAVVENGAMGAICSDGINDIASNKFIGSTQSLKCEKQGSGGQGGNGGGGGGGGF